MAQIGRSVLTKTAHDVAHLSFCERFWIKGERPRQIQQFVAVGVRPCRNL